MNKVGKNMKILRLSLFNLKRNKKEALAIAFLAMVTSLLLSVFIVNNSKKSKAFDKAFEESGCVDHIVSFDKDKYRDEYLGILEDEYNVDDNIEIDTLFSESAEIIDKAGDKVSYNMYFIKERDERKLEDFTIFDSLSDDELSGVGHPIWMPEAFKLTQGYKTGDTFILINNAKEYEYIVAGFYKTGLYNSRGWGFKFVVSDEDYELLSRMFNTSYAKEYHNIGFNSIDFSYDDYIDKCEKESLENTKAYATYIFSEYEEGSEAEYIDIFLTIIGAISIVTLIAAIFVIRHKISNDIDDQMQQIGVLEALGYRSREISLSYLYEYVISCGIGAGIGGLLSVFAAPVIESALSSLMGRDVTSGNIDILKTVCITLSVIVLISLFALFKARTVKKFPPVIAFRKGIKTHHFKKNILPLEKTKGNVNRRLAFKSILMDIKTNLGIVVCIILSGTTLLFGVMNYSFFSKGTKGLESLFGVDTNSIMITTVSGVDIEGMRDELAANPSVRKARIAFEMEDIKVKDSDSRIVITYEDYKDADMIKTTEGRFPEKDNEIAISVSRSKMDNKYIGDSIVLEYNGIEKEYIITGTVCSMMNNRGSVLYLTNEGYQRIAADKRPNVIYIYLNDDVNEEDFIDKIYEMYGGSAKDSIGKENESETEEERIKNAADEKIATLLAEYGVTSVDYAVRVGDKLITGNSRRYQIREILSWQGMIKAQMEGISKVSKYATIAAVIVVAIIVAVILGMLSASNVKRKRRDYGIMKSMGYSSKDLMTQIAIGIIPAVIISMVIASVIAVYLNKSVWMLGFGAVAGSHIPEIIIADIVMVVFCYVVTYISAGKIKKISVTELMTE
ncbi:ABC-type transport system, involved in lipoprotein release, permease component [Lachnospiraceae bacterium]|nr:ABC-type transport system, involved in lipoprotein release, permease component [Lachnospiraceae bacterium]